MRLPLGCWLQQRHHKLTWWEFLLPATPFSGELARGRRPSTAAGRASPWGHPGASRHGSWLPRDRDRQMERHMQRETEVERWREISLVSFPDRLPRGRPRAPLLLCGLCGLCGPGGEECPPSVWDPRPLNGHDSPFSLSHLDFGTPFHSGRRTHHPRKMRSPVTHLGTQQVLCKCESPGGRAAVQVGLNQREVILWPRTLVAWGTEGSRPQDVHLPSPLRAGFAIGGQDMGR